MSDLENVETKKNKMEEPTQDKLPENTGVFLRIGIIVLSMIVMISLGMKIVPNAVETMKSTNKRELPIYCVNTDEKKVSLSFDAAWGNEQTQTLLDILKKHDVKVTFFLTGTWINKYPESVKAIYEEGHDIGNHSENHKQMSKLSKADCVKEIMTPHEHVKELLGIDMNLFRPPYGDYNNTLIEAARENGYHVIQWDVDSLDWKDYGTASIIKMVTQNPHLGNGSIILMHNGAKFTPDALETIITTLKSEGYELVPISKLIYTENYEIDHEGRQFQK